MELACILQGRVRNRDRRKKPKSAARGTNLLPRWLNLVSLPGGEFTIPIDDGENYVSLHRAESPGVRLSSVRLADPSGGECGEEAEKGMLPAIFPHSVFSYARTNTTVAATAELLEPAFSMLNISGDVVFTSSPSARTED